MNIANHIAGMSGFSIFFLLAILVCWLVTLVLALRNNALNDITRFMWVFIVVMVPFLGWLLYLMMAPPHNGPGLLSEVAENEARSKMTGVYEKTEWRNR